jgi:predicted dehydrogenase
MRMISAALMALGRWGKSIVEAVQERSRRIRVVHGVSKEPEAVRDFAARHGFRLSTAFEEAIADPLVEAVFLATPHSLHVDQVVAAAEAGKHVWCEKPLALKRQEAQRAVEACRRAGVLLATGFNKRCFASMRELKRLLDSDALGEILHLEGHYCNEHSTRVSGGWRDDPSESPGGGMTGAGLHVLDAFINLAGPVAHVDARLFSRKPGPDPRDALAISLQFATGATGLMGTVRAGPFYWRVHAFGTKGWAEASGEDAGGDWRRAVPDITGANDRNDRRFRGGHQLGRDGPTCRACLGNRRSARAGWMTFNTAHRRGEKLIGFRPH